jgi:DNA polymerase-3 subunit delta'
MTENWGLLGHEWAVELLQAQLRNGGQRHAYLVTGPAGVGRRTLALALAKALNCEQPPAAGEFCNACRTCDQMNRMQHADLATVQREAGDRDIRVEAIRDLQHTLALAPYAAKYRIALLLNFEEANASAANALLKTLEEPPPRVVLILTAESAEGLLPTIASRCEMLKLRPLVLDALETGLKQRGIPAKQAKLLAHVAGGRPGYALRLHQNEGLLEQRASWLDEQHDLLAANRKARFDYAEALGKDKEGFEAQREVWLSFWRDVLLQAGQAGAPLANVDRQTEIEGLAGKLSLNQAKRVVRALEHTRELLRTNTNPRLAAEILLLDFPKQ